MRAMRLRKTLKTASKKSCIPSTKGDIRLEESIMIIEIGTNQYNQLQEDDDNLTPSSQTSAVGDSSRDSSTGYICMKNPCIESVEHSSIQMQNLNLKYQKKHNSSSRETAKANQKRLTIVLGICVCFFIVELIGGLLTRSLALLADSLHLLGDCASYLVALFAIFLGQKSRSKRFSFGFARAEILGALVIKSTLF